MYRMTSEDGRALISADPIFQNYARNDVNSLHEKNLFHLGEDRMLTTLLLKLFPDMSLSFVPIASCWTIVPDQFKVLLSQRRRWINSTFHNMWELMKVNTMCGFCCISMNTIIIVDTICTLILPASIIYGAAYTYTAIVDDAGMSMITIVLYGVLFGAQMLIFLARSRFDYLLWFFIYLILGVPVFYFILPVYSFWHMDDFSWGTTRQVAAGKKPKAPSGAAAAVPSQKPKPSQPKQDRPRPPVLPIVSDDRPKNVRRSEPPVRPAGHNYPVGHNYQGKTQSMGGGQGNARSDSWEDGYRTGSTASSFESAAMKNKRVAKAKPTTPPAVKSNGPVGLDNDLSPSPTPKKEIQPITFGSFDGDDDDQVFDDLYDDDMGPDQVAV